jgi:hypothetical protein
MSNPHWKLVIPYGHVRQSAGESEPHLVEYVPSGHADPHTTAPDETSNVPGSHNLQSMTFETPNALLNFPGGHETHEPIDPNRPRGHGTH